MGTPLEVYRTDTGSLTTRLRCAAIMGRLLILPVTLNGSVVIEIMPETELQKGSCSVLGSTCVKEEIRQVGPSIFNPEAPVLPIHDGKDCASHQYLAAKVCTIYENV